MTSTTPEPTRDRFLRLLADKYPTPESAIERIVHLSARLTLPKGSEHFLSDLHGEFATFYHILNNCSGIIHEKVNYLFAHAGVGRADRAEFCTLIYYPREKLESVAAKGRATPEWHRLMLQRLLTLAQFMAFKYPVAKIAHLVPREFATVISELLCTHPDDDSAQLTYHNQLLDSIVGIGAAPAFIETLSLLIKRLAVDRVHIIGDFFDRGSRPDAILNATMQLPSLDIQWGNHDVLWMGAAAGSEACIANVVYNSLKYDNTEVLENGYGISLRPLYLWASQAYAGESASASAKQAMAVIMFKLESQLIKRNPKLDMAARCLLDCVDYKWATLTLNGQTYPMKKAEFPTIDAADPSRLSEEEQRLVAELRNAFLGSLQLRRHIDFIYRHGNVYKRCNGNLLFHGCVPMNSDGTFTEVDLGEGARMGRELFDWTESVCRRAWSERDQRALDLMWYFWCGRRSPFAGREFRTFERLFVEDKATHEEPDDDYFRLVNESEVCARVLAEFGLDAERGHIINGHLPVKKGTSPIKANGKALVIDGGFCHAYHEKTGLSGFTLVSNSRGLRLLMHQTIADVRTALEDNRDIESVSEIVDLQAYRMTVGDTDEGGRIRAEIDDLTRLLAAYRSGKIHVGEGN